MNDIRAGAGSGVRAEPLVVPSTPVEVAPVAGAARRDASAGAATALAAADAAAATTTEFALATVALAAAAARRWRGCAR